ncbi:MAG: hypothetical protein LBT16_13585 [Treponema sp.]|jgi:DNA-binding transcriptional regulator YiaG|nr:hypothetical protein [Treponema sp.]
MGKGSVQYGVHRRIRELRHTLKLSQVKFAAAIFISNGYLVKVGTLPGK